MQAQVLRIREHGREIAKVVKVIRCLITPTTFPFRRAVTSHQLIDNLSSAGTLKHPLVLNARVIKLTTSVLDRREQELANRAKPQLARTTHIRMSVHNMSQQRRTSTHKGQYEYWRTNRLIIGCVYFATFGVRYHNR